MKSAPIKAGSMSVTMDNGTDPVLIITHDKQTVTVNLLKGMGTMSRSERRIVGEWALQALAKSAQPKDK